MTNSVFCGLNFTNHVFNIFISEFNFLSIWCRLVEEEDNEVSSANSLTKLDKWSEISLMYIRKSKGSNTEQWGTPALSNLMVFFLKKYSDSQCCWKKHSDFGAGKKKSDSEFL